MVTAAIVALAVGLLASALSAGFFWAWSFTVMPGLAAAPPEAAIAAMRAMNAGIGGPGFAFVFFGPALFAALGWVLALGAGLPAAAWASFVGAALYGLGVIAVTFVVNLRLNAELAAASVAPGAAAGVWRGYARPWITWNHGRTTAATLAFLALAAALVLAARG